MRRLLRVRHTQKGPLDSLRRYSWIRLKLNLFKKYSHHQNLIQSRDILCFAEKQCASSCRRGSNLSYCFSAQQRCGNNQRIVTTTTGYHFTNYRRHTTSYISSQPDIFFLKHDSSIFRQLSNPVSGFCWLGFVLFGPQRTGLALPWTTYKVKDCLNMLLLCFRKSMSALNTTKRADFTDFPI